MQRPWHTKVLYLAPLWPGSTGLQRFRAFQDLGYEMTGIDTSPPWGSNSPPLSHRILYKLLDSPDLQRINWKIIRAINESTYDILWIDKGLFLKPKTLKKVKRISPKTLIIGYSPDDMKAKYNQSRHFLKGLDFYDLYITTKSFNVEELRLLGCPKVIFIDNAFDIYTHRPMAISEIERVGFIGTYEAERAKSIFFLAQHGIPVEIWGNNWLSKCKLHSQNLKIKGMSQYGDMYAKLICSFDIVLCFLRKNNRDLQTTRSIEIPACGAFMLAERTNEHLGLFEEGKEAEFFSSDEELLAKVKYYLEHEEERRRIALAGRERCFNSGYSNHERIKEIMKIIAEISDEKRVHL
jgi:hypothetical protein